MQHPAKRQQLIDDLAEKRITVAEFEQRVRGIKAAKPRGPGRAPAVPHSLLQAFDKLQALSKTYLNNFQQVLFGEKFDIPSQLQASADAHLDDRLREAITGSADQLGELERAVQAARTRLAAELKRLDEARVRQEESDRRIDEVERAEHIPMKERSCNNRKRKAIASAI